MKVLVTGAHGFLGRHLCQALRLQGHDVMAPSSTELDITSPFEWPGFMDVVIHLAAYNITSVGPKSEEAYTRVNIKGTEHVARGVSFGRFILLSTLKVHENPLSAYAKSKQEAETVCRALVPARSLVILRCANIWGAGQAAKAIVPIFTHQAKRQAPIEITAHPLTLLHYLDVRDAVDLLLSMIAHPEKSGTYEAAYPIPVTIETLARKIIAAYSSSSTITYAAASHLPSSRAMDCTATWDDFNFSPRHNIDAILAHMKET